MSDLKIIDPHIDIADMYAYMGFEAKDFIQSKSKAPVSLEKLKQLKTKLAGFTLYFDKSLLKTNFFDGAMEFYHFYKEIEEQSNQLVQITSSEEIHNLTEEQVGYFLSIEGLECFRSPDDFHHFYNLGVRVFGLTWDYVNDYAFPHAVSNTDGLTLEGKRLLKTMSQHKLILDLAHLGNQSIYDAADNFDGMIVTTHGNVYAIHGRGNNLLDDQIQIIADRGGVVSLFPLVSCVGEDSFDKFNEHIEYIAGRWGEDVVAISSDIYPLEEYPFLGGHKDILILNALKEYLLTKYSEKQVERFMFGNWYRILTTTL